VEAVAAVEGELGTGRSHTNTCSHTARTIKLRDVLRIYASLPLRGPAGGAGRDILRGAQLALERSGTTGVELAALDSFGADREARAVANARRAAEDAAGVAYLGDFHSSQVMETAPILAAAGLLGVTPSATYSGLGGPTLVRLMPDDRALSRGIAGWVAQRGIRRTLVIHDHDDGYGVPVGAMCTQALQAAGVDVGSRPVWDHPDAMAADVAGHEAVLYAGVAGPGAAGLWHDLHRLDATLRLLGTDGLATERFARDLGAGAAARTLLFTAQRAPWGFYGYEAAALILDALAEAGENRLALIEAARRTHDRDSALGRYSIDEDGLTTAPADGRLAVVDGELVWDREP
jgi:ABC-type branched-subunit amino acid transport system substrate-binding protein